MYGVCMSGRSLVIVSFVIVFSGENCVDQKNEIMTGKGLVLNITSKRMRRG